MAENLNNKICLITGATSGIGKATALEIAKLGATTILLCRNEKLGNQTAEEIKQKTNNQKIDLFVVDLSSQKEIKEFAEQFKQKYSQLHILINNAGVYLTKRQTTVDNLETTFAVNYLAYFLLTNLLLDVIKKCESARIINVAGSYHTKGKINFDDLQLEKNYNGFTATYQSQLARILFTYELSRQLQATGVTVNCLHPGAIATPMIEKDKDCPKAMKFFYNIGKYFLKSPQKGAETIIYLAVSDEVNNITGKYFVNKEIVLSSPLSYDIALAKQLWDMSLQLIRKNV